MQSRCGEESEWGIGCKNIRSLWRSTHPGEVKDSRKQSYMSQDSKHPVQAPLSHQPSLTKHKLEDKIIKTFNMMKTEH